MRTVGFRDAALTAGLLLLLVLPGAACRSKECVPGQQIACACPGGEQGAQTCDQDGSGYLPCVCLAAPASAPPAAAPQGAATSGRAAPGGGSDEGTDPRRPELAPDDASFVDTRGGWGWNDRCWINLKKGKWGWAKAECDAALRMNPASPMPLASVLYNLGLIEKAAGDTEAARIYFERSLALREHPEVRSALAALPGGAPPKPKKQIACGGTTCDAVCCVAIGEKCASSPDQCERATNGEGTIFTCDGPEDCGGGEVCCLIPMERTTAAECITRAKCTGEYQHPRYQTSIPLQVVCHASMDCAGGRQCARGEASGGLSVCK